MEYTALFTLPAAATTTSHILQPEGSISTIQGKRVLKYTSASQLQTGGWRKVYYPESGERRKFWTWDMGWETQNIIQGFSV